MTAIKPRESRVVIYQGDDIAMLAQLDDSVTRAQRALDVAKKATTPTLMGEDAPAVDAAEALDAATARRDKFAAEAEERGVVVMLTAQPRSAWRRLVRENPARPDADDDKPFGINMDSLPDVLLPLSIDHERSTIEGDTVEFLDSLSDYDYYDRLFLTAFALNRGAAMADPTRRLLSLSSQTSDATSN